MATWSGYYSRMQDCSSLKHRAEIGILPLFPDKSTDPCLVKHVMLIVKQSIEFLNPGQTPVLGCDQPLFALAKQLQWQFPSILCDDKYVILIGGLHIESKAHLMLGKFIRGSGWEWAMSEAGCSPLVELYPPWMTTILSALGMLIKFHWWPSISSSKKHTQYIPQIQKVTLTHLTNSVPNSSGIDVCLSTGHSLSSLNFSFVDLCTL